MTNVYEEQDNLKYFSLKFVEFQDLLCRVALQYFAEKEEEGSSGPADLEDKVHAILEMLWARRVKKQASKPKHKQSDKAARARGSRRRRQ